MFVPGSHREQITWLSLIGIAMQDSQYETSNATYLRFEIQGKVYIWGKITTQSKSNEKLNGKQSHSNSMYNHRYYSL